MILKNTAILYYTTSQFSAFSQAESIFHKTNKSNNQKGECLTMSCNSAIFTANKNIQDIPIGGSIDLGTTIRRYGKGVTRSGDSIILCGSGYYDVNVGVTAVPKAVGTVTVTLYQDGVPVPGASASATVAATETSVSLAFPAIVRLCGQCCTSNLKLVVSDVETDITNIGVTVKKI